jgi:Flp pilus assembly pilin Flp
MSTFWPHKRLIRRISMLRRNFFKEEDASVVIEYMLLAGAALILLGAGVGLAMGSMSNYFGAWAGFFNSAGSSP